MANNCYNNVIVSELLPDQKEYLLKWLDSYSTFNNTLLWVTSLDFEFPKLELQRNVFIVPSWWDFEVNAEEEDTIYISGDSAWSDFSEIFLIISKMFPNIEINYYYIERGHDISGEITMKNGIKTGLEGTVLEVIMYTKDWDYIDYYDLEQLPSIKEAFKKVGDPKDLPLLKSTLFEMWCNELKIKEIDPQYKEEFEDLLFGGQFELLKQLIKSTK